MLYIVECSYNDPESEQAWNDFYSLEKLPALLSVAGFSSSQRFRAISAGCPVYLAIHTVKDAEVLVGDDYRHKGGGHFSHGQANITDWHRNLYEYAGTTPAVSPDEILAITPRPVKLIQALPERHVLELKAAGLDKYPARRFAYVIPRENAPLLAAESGVCLYEALTPQCSAARHENRACLLNAPRGLYE